MTVYVFFFFDQNWITEISSLCIKDVSGQCLLQLCQQKGLSCHKLQFEDTLEMPAHLLSLEQLATDQKSHLLEQVFTS